MTPNQIRLLQKARDNRKEACPIVCLHILEQILVNELCAIINELQDKIDDLSKQNDILGGQ